MPVNREFLHPEFVRKPLDAVAAGLDYPSTEVGTVGKITVYYATSLGTAGKTLGSEILGRVVGTYGEMEAFFGIQGGSVSVIVAPLSGKNDGSGGAYHYGCDFTSGGTIYVDATFALPNAADVEMALYVAELSECFMGAQGRGWGCGYSNGEGLSRFCAEVSTPYGSFPSWGITGPSWVSAGYPDWVTTTEQTDRDYASTGCAILYIYWMLSLGYSKAEVTQAGGATLADNYKTLTGKSTAYADLKAATQAVTVNSDNPFGIVEPNLMKRVAHNADGRLEVFAQGTDNALWHIWQTAPNNGWSGWASLGGIITSEPEVARNADGRLEVFARGTDNALWHMWQTAPNNGWSGWASLGGTITSDPVIATDANGCIEVFARGTDKALWHIWQTAPNNGWSGWASLGGIITSEPEVARNADGRLEAFARGTDHALWHIWQTAANKETWSGWASLGGIITSEPVIATDANGCIEVFARGTDNALWHIWQTAPSNGWSSWASLGGIITSEASVGRNADGRLEAFARGTDNALWHIWQTAANKETWSGWASLGGEITSSPVVTSDADGRLEVFARGTDNALWHMWQTAPSNGWSGWASLGGILVCP